MLRALLVATVTGAPVERRELMLRHRQPRPWVHLQGIRPARQADEPVPRRTGVAPARAPERGEARAPARGPRRRAARGADRRAPQAASGARRSFVNCACTLQDAPSFLSVLNICISPSLQCWNSSFLRRTDNRSGLLTLRARRLFSRSNFDERSIPLLPNRPHQETGKFLHYFVNNSAHAFASLLIGKRKTRCRMGARLATSQPSRPRHTIPGSCERALDPSILHRHASRDCRICLRSQPLCRAREPDTCVGPGHRTEHRRLRRLVPVSRYAPIHDEHRCP